jgi:hypothetical protein
MEQRFDEMEDHFDNKLMGVNRRLDNLEVKMDASIKAFLDHDQEIAVTNHRVARHDDWIDHAAKQLKIPYSP